MTKKSKKSTPIFRVSHEPERVTETLDYHLSLEGTIDDVVHYLREKEKDAASRGITQLSIHDEPNYDGSYYELRGWRDETTAEIASRVKRETAKKIRFESEEANRLAKKEKEERKELARLKRLYERISDAD